VFLMVTDRIRHRHCFIISDVMRQCLSEDVNSLVCPRRCTGPEQIEKKHMQLLTGSLRFMQGGNWLQNDVSICGYVWVSK